MDALDIAIDGADEVDPALNLVKGGGGAHFRERMVAELAERFVVVVDESKLVDRLGDFGVPVEVMDFGQDVVARRLRAEGARSVLVRAATSDNGNLILDADFGLLDDPLDLADRLKAITGVIAHGIFPGELVSEVMVGPVRRLDRRPDPRHLTVLGCVGRLGAPQRTRSRSIRGGLRLPVGIRARSRVTAMPGAVAIVVILLLIPVLVLMTGGIVAAVLGWSHQRRRRPQPRGQRADRDELLSSFVWSSVG